MTDVTGFPSEVSASLRLARRPGMPRQPGNDSRKTETVLFAAERIKVKSMLQSNTENTQSNCNSCTFCLSAVVFAVVVNAKRCGSTLLHQETGSHIDAAHVASECEIVLWLRRKSAEQPKIYRFRSQKCETLVPNDANAKEQ